jgi:hypothetical protein
MGATALYADAAAELVRLKAHRTLVLTQIDRVISGGQSFGNIGGANITQVSLADLKKDLADTERQILLITNGSNNLTVYPDFGGDADGDLWYE